MASQDERSATEWGVLGLLAEHPAHGFALARHLAPGGDIGKVYTVRRPLVYRALDRLVADGLAAPARTEPGDAGPRRTIHRITPTGRQEYEGWLDTPVLHVRDLRVDFLLKLALLRRAGRASDLLVARQRATLAPTLDAIEAAGGDHPDEVDLWRSYNAAAVRQFLDRLAAG